MNRLVILDEKINIIINKRNLAWVSGIKNAHIVLKQFHAYTSIPDMFFDPESQLVNELHYDTLRLNYTKSDCLKDLNINYTSYQNFVLAALLYSLKYEIQESRPNFYFLSQLISQTLLCEAPKGSLEYEFFHIVKKLNVFSIFEKDCLAGVLSLLLSSFYKKAKLSLAVIKRVLILFNFPNDFIEECINDCFKEKSFGPLVLALYVQEVKSEKNVDFRNVNPPETKTELKRVDIEKHAPAFNNFKKSLVKTKKLSRLFFVKLKFKPKNIKIFYNLSFA